MKNLLICIALAVVASVVLVGCWQKSDPRLACAEAVMESQPDSALRIVSAINPDEFSDARNRALFGLLSTQARVKCDIPIDDDSLIDASVGYFREHGPDSNLMKSLFYQGTVRCDNGDLVGSIVPAMVARDMAIESHSDYWHAKAAELIADVYGATYNYYEAISYNKEALIYYERAGKRLNHLYSICDLGLRLNSVRKFDDSKELLDSVERIALCELNDSALISYIRAYSFYGLFRGEKYDEARVAYEKLLEVCDSSHLSLPDVCAKAILDIREGDFLIAETLLSEYTNRSSLLSELDRLAFYGFLRAYYEAEGNMRKVVEYSDSLSSVQDSAAAKALWNSVSARYSGYVSEQNKYNLIRLKDLKIRIVSVACIAILLTIVVILLVLRYKNKQIDRRVADILLLNREVDQQRQMYQSVSQLLEKAESDKDELHKVVGRLYRDSLSTIDKFCDRYSEDNSSEKGKLLFIKAVQKEIEKMRNPDNIRQIEASVNLYLGGVLARLKEECPFLRQEDVTLLALIYSGLSPRSISFMLGFKLKTFYTKKSRLKNRILASNPHLVDLLY